MLVVEEVLSEIDEALEKLRDEAERLENAKGILLQGDLPAARPTAGRAPRGHTEERIFATIRANPGISTTALAEASGISRTQTYSVLKRLLAKGRVTRSYRSLEVVS